MIDEKQITHELHKISNNIEISFTENMINYIFVLTDLDNAMLIVLAFNKMFENDETLSVDVFKNICSDAYVVTCSVE